MRTCAIAIISASGNPPGSPLHSLRMYTGLGASSTTSLSFRDTDVTSILEMSSLGNIARPKSAEIWIVTRNLTSRSIIERFSATALESPELICEIAACLP